MKKRIRLLAAIVMAVMMLSMLAAPVLADASSSDMRHSVVYVEVGAVDGSNYIPLCSGTGFFVGENGKNPQYLLTNDHVIRTFIQCGSGELMTLDLDSVGTVSIRAIIRAYFDNDDYVEAYLVDNDSIRDMALLKLEKPTDKRSAMKISIPKEEMVTKTVYSVGYPGLADTRLIESVHQKGEKDATVATGTVSRLLVQSGKGVATVQTDAAIMHGNSGGPLVFENGAAIGITSWGVTNPGEMEGVKYALSMEEVVPMLERNHVPFVEQEWPERRISPVLWIVLALGVAVVVAVLVVNSRRRAAAAQEPISPAPPVSPAPAAPKKNNRDSGYRIQGVSGELEGRRFLVPNEEPVIMGRNAQVCGVVFPEGTGGVSGRHCAVWMEKGEVRLKDLGSSHGTYLEPGQRIAAEQSVVLHDGQTFWLGSEKESFVLAKKQG